MHSLHPRIKLTLDLAEALVAAADAAARTAKNIRAQSRPAKGETLRPGSDTPLWNELSQTLRSLSWKHGEKARLGRLLGLPRQRIDDFIVGRRRLPDAERTLILLHWLGARSRGIHLG